MAAIPQLTGNTEAGRYEVDTWRDQDPYSNGRFYPANANNVAIDCSFVRFQDVDLFHRVSSIAMRYLGHRCFLSVFSAVKVEENGQYFYFLIVERISHTLQTYFAAPNTMWEGQQFLRQQFRQAIRGLLECFRILKNEKIEHVDVNIDNVFIARGEVKILFAHTIHTDTTTEFGWQIVGRSRPTSNWGNVVIRTKKQLGELLPRLLDPTRTLRSQWLFRDLGDFLALCDSLSQFTQLHPLLLGTRERFLFPVVADLALRMYTRCASDIDKLFDGTQANTGFSRHWMHMVERGSEAQVILERPRRLNLPPYNNRSSSHRSFVRNYTVHAKDEETRKERNNLENAIARQGKLQMNDMIGQLNKCRGYLCDLFYVC